MSVPQITIVVPGRWHAFDLAKELEQLGALHRIVTTQPRARAVRWGLPESKIFSLPATHYAWSVLSRSGGERWSTRFSFRLNDLFARRAARRLGRPDLVHAWSGSAEPVLAQASKVRIPTVLERSSSHMAEQCRILSSEYAALGINGIETPRTTVERELREYGLVDRVFVPSLFVERSFLARGFPADRLFRNGFGVDLSRFTPGARSDEVFRVIYAGSMSVRKGLHHLVRAFREANISNSELLLVGGSLPETELLIGAPDARIRRVGHVPQTELPALYRTGSVFAMASVEEGQALVQAQALACGLPLICTTNTGGEDFLATSGTGESRASGLTEFPTGYLVPVAHSLAMAAAFRELAADRTRLAAKQSAARGLAARDLSWRRYAAANLAEYERIVAQRGKTAA